MSDVAGKRICIVEDEAIIAMALEDLLEELGCVIAGSAATLDAAAALARAADCDAAILDININGTRSDEIARLFADRRIPVIFATGYGSRCAPDPAAPVLDKPYRRQQLQDALAAALSA